MIIDVTAELMPLKGTFVAGLTVNEMLPVAAEFMFGRSLSSGGPEHHVYFSRCPFEASVITSKAANSYHFKTGQRDWPSRTENVLPCRLQWWQVGFGTPAPWTALEHMAVVQ